MKMHVKWYAWILIMILPCISLYRFLTVDSFSQLDFVEVLVHVFLIGYPIVWLSWYLLGIRIMYGWLLLAQEPSAALARGDKEGAERKFTKALARVQRFPANDQRRGIMLCELARYSEGQGRRTQAATLHHEAIDILVGHADVQPGHYLVALNNYALFCMNGKDYAAAETTLEKLIDFIPLAKKLGNDKALSATHDVLVLDFLFHLNLAQLLIGISEFKEAGLHIQETEAIFSQIQKEKQAELSTVMLCLRPAWHSAMGEFEKAWHDCEGAADPKSPVLWLVRAKVALSHGQHAEAERFLRDSLKMAQKMGTMHRPELLEININLSEALFGQAKHDDAFASLQEARSIVTDFALPPDAAWKKTLETWLERARELGKAGLAASLDAELQHIPATANQAITILEKFRIHPHAAE